MASSSAAVARSLQIPRWEHDVFLSFRGSDTRKSFTSHLYEALMNKGINTFLDDKKLEHGASISQELLKAIEESQVAVIIFSKDYASSSWCLDELVKILECKDESGQTVIPVFYDVDPSTIRHQKRSYAEAFGKHESRFKDDVVQRWRTALTAVADLRGYDIGQGTESETIKQIVNQISSTLCKSISGKNLQLLNKLKTKLPALQCVLNDEEITQPFSSNPPQWLNGLRSVADRAENLMEEINYEILRIRVEDKHPNLVETRNQDICNLYSCLSDEFFINIKERLEHAIETLEELQKQIGDLGLIKSSLDLGKQETRTPSTSMVDDSDIFGRHDEIKDLVDRVLLADVSGKNLTIIPILGMGGIGKTTLAQVVYNDENVEGHFDLKAWFCVSEPYDTLAITKGLLQEIDLFDLKDDNNLNQLQIKLKKGLKGKKFLIVLDDVWNDNYNEWDDMRKLFVQGMTGSKIIVTTRKESVAKMMGCGAINVAILSSEASWALFKRHALGNKDPEEHAELEEMGKQIAQKCKGLPLALKALGGILRSKFEVEEWRGILRSDTWELSSRSNGILPALMLSYNDLPVHMKRCFSYCAIFPKDYQFCKEQVIHLWVANGLVQRFHSGNQYFLELISRSLFERLPNSPQGKIEKFLMHDLVNDLAQIASSKLCLRLEDHEGSHMLKQSRHLSYSMGYIGEFEKLKPLYELEQLRTLLPVNSGSTISLSKRVLYNTLPRLTYLRALSLSHYQIKELPDVLFIKLKLLRFLDLSRTEIERLPDSICVLYNLETLLLSSCPYLEELPLQMEKLINLRRLDISNAFRLKILLHPSKLKSLHVLMGANFLLSGCSGSSIKDLDELHNLHGSLSISELQHVVDRREAQKAKLREKERVEKLSLKWNGDTAENSQNERNILDELRPNRNIKELNIEGYRGTSFPDWLADELFLKLVRLALSNCKDCYSLPALGKLPSLKFLFIRGMDRITIVAEEFYGEHSSSRMPFNSLEELQFEEMLEWKEWHVLGTGEFPKLHKLIIYDCPKLIGKLPENLCSLTRLKISRCPQLILETHIHLSSLKKLEFEDCDSLACLPFSSVPSTLKEMRMRRCGKLKLELSVSEMMSRGCNVFLDRLELEQCNSVDVMSKELILRARTLEVAECRDLARFVIPVGTEDVQIHECENLETLSVPFNLEVLWIEDCKKLVNGRKKWGLQKLSCLRELGIWHDGSDEVIVGDKNWELPCSIQNLKVCNLKTLSSKILKSLTSLDYLQISNLPQIKSLLEEGLPPSISTLILQNHEELHSLPADGLQYLTSLQNLRIYNCNQLQSLPESTLPSSLSELVIENCLNFQTLGESVLPSSLVQLEICECPNLKSLPVRGMPSSISHIYVFECPSLEELLEFEKGDYWPYIAHIPTIEIDDEYL